MRRQANFLKDRQVVGFLRILERDLYKFVHSALKVAVREDPNMTDSALQVLGDELKKMLNNMVANVVLAKINEHGVALSLGRKNHLLTRAAQTKLQFRQALRQEMRKLAKPAPPWLKKQWDAFLLKKRIPMVDGKNYDRLRKEFAKWVDDPYVMSFDFPRT